MAKEHGATLDNCGDVVLVSVATYYAWTQQGPALQALASIFHYMTDEQKEREENFRDCRCGHCRAFPDIAGARAARHNARRVRL